MIVNLIQYINMHVNKQLRVYCLFFNIKYACKKSWKILLQHPKCTNRTFFAVQKCCINEDTQEMQQ